MECKFIKHGIAVSYDHIVKPCCDWRVNSDWQEQNHLKQTKLDTWHQSPQVLHTLKQLEQDTWPSACVSCEKKEAQGRNDSTRKSSNRSYADYNSNDITLEIRPGSVCNFACQTCWPEASSRVAQFHHQAGIIDIKSVDSTSMDNFDFLTPVAHRIRDVVLLGGEPFYDKSCKRFLSWAQENLTANLMMFTNGSMIDFDFLSSYPGKLTLVFSLDAVDRAAEYVRYGTVWSQVLENYQRVRTLPNVEVRVNITTSIYNYAYLESLMEFLCQDWPDLVTFGVPSDQKYRESVIPLKNRNSLIQSLQQVAMLILKTNIESGQKQNAINAINSHIRNLQNNDWDQVNHQKLCDFILRLDQVKNISIQDYCPETYSLLQN